jgi:hypothetical protein
MVSPKVALNFAFTAGIAETPRFAGSVWRGARCDIAIAIDKK